MVYASIHLQREYKGKSVAVLPQTVVVPAGIPSRCPGTVPARLLRIWRLGMTVKGKKHSDESKLKMSAAKKGERHPNSGKKLSDETKLKMSAAKKGKRMSDESELKISAAKKGKRNPCFGMATAVHGPGMSHRRR